MDFMRNKPDKFYKLAIVDPPYGLGSMSHGLGTKVKHKRKHWNDNPPNNKYFKELRRISFNQIIWGCNYFYPNIPESGRIVHNKLMTSGNGCPIKLSEADLASQTFNKRIDLFTYQWSGNVQNGKINWNNTGLDARIHPTQKPIALYRWLLQKYTKPGDNIFDSHGGSMSIAIACDMEGFDLDICEIDKEYFDAGVKRFNIYKQQKVIDFNI